MLAVVKRPLFIVLCSCILLSGLMNLRGSVIWYIDSLTRKPIPNRWFLDHQLLLGKGNPPQEDPDRDGFANEDEYRARTDPNDKNSHPEYYTKLFFQKYVPVTFELKFLAYDGDPKKPETVEFQINMMDRGKSVFLKLGEKVSGDRYQLRKFMYKTRYNARSGGQEDCSELTILDTEAGNDMILPLNQLIDSTESSVVFLYEWPKPRAEIEVKIGRTFMLEPETKRPLRLLAGQKDQAVIENSKGEKVTIVPDPRLSDRRERNAK